MKFHLFRQRYLQKIYRSYSLHLVILLQSYLLIRLFLNYNDLYRVSNTTTPDTFWYIHHHHDRRVVPQLLKSPVLISNDAVLVMACGRNVEKMLPGFRRNLYRVVRLFHTYRILLGESDSTDRTLSDMHEWERMDSHVHLYSYGNLSDTYSTYRTRRIAFCRNDLLRRARHHRWLDESKYLLVMDIDVNSQPILTINSFRSNFRYDLSGWAAMTATQTTTYYDIWALRTEIVDYDCWEMVELFKHQDIAIKKYIAPHTKVIPIDFGLIPVHSAFGGFAIYQTKYLTNCLYDGTGDRLKETCEHVAFHRCIVDNGGKIFINPRFRNSNGTYV